MIGSANTSRLFDEVEDELVYNPQLFIAELFQVLGNHLFEVISFRSHVSVLLLRDDICSS